MTQNLAARRPFMQFYPRDWRSDIALQYCSLAARGLWIELVGIMHEANPYGYLIIGSNRYGVDDALKIGQIIHATTSATRRGLRELVEKRVCEIDEDGTIFSRRMVRDEQRRLNNIANGELGGVPWAPRDGLTRKQREARARQIGTHTPAQWAEMKRRCGSICVVCRTPEAKLEGGALCKDHVIPISLGGSDHLSNIQPICRQCNTKRGDRGEDLRPAEVIAWSNAEPGYNQGYNQGYNRDSPHARPREGARDRDPETRDQSIEPAAPVARAHAHEDPNAPLDDDDLGGAQRPVRVGPALDFARWFIREAMAAGAIAKHFRADDAAYKQAPDAEALVAVYSLDELERRGRNLIARKKHPTDPLTLGCSLRTLAEKWDWFDSPLPLSEQRATTGKTPATPKPRFLDVDALD